MELPRIPRTGLNLRDIFRNSYEANPYQGGDELTPIEHLLRRSQGLDLARQYLPGFLGGYNQETRQRIDAARAADPVIRKNRLRVGDYPVLDGAASIPGGPLAEAARRSAQGAGALVRDAQTQGLQNIWWFINAAEAASMAAGQQVMHGALGPQKLLRRPAIPGAPTGTPFFDAYNKVAAAFPLVLAASAATGNLFRQPGYAAVLPSEEDRRESANPLEERVLRTIGRVGSLLPYEDFVEERPDVSRAQYEAYKAYLHGNKSPIKGTMEGIHGPEVSFMGKSVPVLTGLVPIVGGLIGTGIGMRMAGARLAGIRRGVQAGPNEFFRLADRKQEVSKLWQVLDEAEYNPNVTADGIAKLQAKLDAARLREDEQKHKIDRALLTGTLAGASTGLVTTGAGAMLMEQVRRAAAAEEERRRLAGEPPAELP